MIKSLLLRARFCPKQFPKSTVLVLLTDGVTHPTETLLKFTSCLKWIFLRCQEYKIYSIVKM